MGGGLFCVLSRPRGAFGSGAAAVEPAADSVVARSCGCVAPPVSFYRYTGRTR